MIEIPVKLFRQLLATSNTMSDELMRIVNDNYASHKDEKRLLKELQSVENYVDCLKDVEDYLSKMNSNKR